MSATTNISSVLVLVGVVLLMQACAVSPEHVAPSVATVSQTIAQPADELDSLQEGDTAVFYSGLLAPYGQLTVGRRYHAASGRVCKRMLDASGNKVLFVACRLPSQKWYIRKLFDDPVGSPRPATVMSGTVLRVPPHSNSTGL